MATKIRIQRNSRGIAEVAKSREMQSLIREVTEEVADHARGVAPMVEGVPGVAKLPVETSYTITDRAKGRVILAHAAGLAAQAKHGVLTKAAGAAGLEVKSR